MNSIGGVWVSVFLPQQADVGPGTQPNTVLRRVPATADEARPKLRIGSEPGLANALKRGKRFREGPNGLWLQGSTTLTG